MENIGFLIDLAYEFAYLLAVLTAFLFISLFKGRQAVINIIFGLYLALLISLTFPYTEELLGRFVSPQSLSIGKLILFIAFTFVTTLLASKVMPDEYREGKFEGFGKKLLLSGAATVLVMTFSFNVLPVTEFLSPGTPIQSLFAPQEYFFWWLILPIIILFIL